MNSIQLNEELRDNLDCKDSAILLYEKGYIDRNEYQAIRSKIDKRYSELVIESARIFTVVEREVEDNEENDM